MWNHIPARRPLFYVFSVHVALSKSIFPASVIQWHFTPVDKADCNLNSKNRMKIKLNGIGLLAVLLVLCGPWNSLSAQSPDCQLTFTPQLQLSPQGPQTEQIKAIVYAIDGKFFQLEMPALEASSQRPLVMALPTIKLDDGIHVISYFVETSSGAKMNVIPHIAVEGDPANGSPSAMELVGVGPEDHTCACEDLYEGQQPDANNWFSFNQNAEGGYDLFVSKDHGQHWNQPGFAGWSIGDCPEFIFSTPLEATTKQNEVSQAIPNLEWTAFPSPFVNELHLRMELPQKENVVVRLLDTQGRVIKEMSQTQVNGLLELDFDTSQLAKGPYYINVLTDQASYSRVVIRI